MLFRSVADKLRRQTSLKQFAGLTGEAGRLTITLGVSTLSESLTTTYELVDFADKALYYGKALGRNRVCGDLPVQDPTPSPDESA